MSAFATAREAVSEIETRAIAGSVASVRGLTVLVDALRVPLGSIVRIETARDQSSVVRGEVVGFDGTRALVMLYDESSGIAPGAVCTAERTSASVGTGMALLGRVVDALGRPIDARRAPTSLAARPLHPARTSPLDGTTINDPLSTGVRAIDGLMTIGKGQRMGIFSAPGVGKSMLLGSIARGTTADVSVIALVGERGREVVEFVEETLGPDGLAHSVVVVATGDESPLMRARACFFALSVAESFRDQGKDVLLMVDSLTRFAHAQRQIGLASGEPPATKGFTPSVFSMLPRVLERAGCRREGGSITGIYTVLVEGDEQTDPIADAAKGVLDGHIVLSQDLANRGHFPAIDPLKSISRAATRLVDPHVGKARQTILRLLAARAGADELISIGAYAPGSDPMVDIAIALEEQLDAFLQQPASEGFEFARTCRLLLELEGLIEGMHAQLKQARVSVGGGAG